MVSPQAKGGCVREIYDRGLRLKELRKRRGLSQQEVADRLGVTRSTISAYERNNKSPSLEALEKLAIIYNSSVDYIWGMNKRANIYLDDLTESQQRVIIEIVEKLREEFKKDI